MYLALEHGAVYNDLYAARVDGRIAYALRIEDDGPVITVRPSALADLFGPDNRGERNLMAVVLAGLGAFAGVAFDDLPGLIDEHAPLGQKKMMLMLPSGRRAFQRAGLPVGRPISDPASAIVMDELGEHLALTWPQGPVDESERTKILNQAVAFHRDQLTATIAELSPDRLLDLLLAKHEQQVSTHAMNQQTIASRLACFGERSDLAEHLREEVPRAGSLANVTRFLIEYLAAYPPKGEKRPGRVTQDRLTAIADQLMNRGWMSDLVHFGLDDSPVTMLRSGRLGVDRESNFHEGRERFLSAFAAAEVQRGRENFDEPWRPDGDDDGELVDMVRVDAACSAEWALSLTEIMEFFDALDARADADPVQVCRRADLTSQLTDTLSWPTKKVADAIDQFALGPLQVPADTYLADTDRRPWRYNRGRSLLRRPLVLRGIGPGREVLYGIRTVEAAGRLLCGLIEDARLDARSKPMRTLMSELRQKADLRFNDQVAQTCAAIHGITVRARVDRIAGCFMASPAGDPLGDIDVLAMDPRRRRLYLIEAKHLSAARTPTEIDREVRRNFSSGRAKAAVEKHRRRTSWVADRLDETLAWLGGDDSDGWQIEPLIVTDLEAFGSFVVDVPMLVLAHRDLPDHLTRP